MLNSFSEKLISALCSVDVTLYRYEQKSARKILIYIH